MPTEKQRCKQCGNPVPAGANYCKVCGTPTGAINAPQAETVIGHLPVQRLEAGMGLFGRTRKTQMNIVITTSRLLYLHASDAMNDRWLGETERIFQEEQASGLPWRALIDSYDWRNPLWADFYDTPPEALLTAHRDNEALPLANITLAEITLDEVWDKLDILIASGEMDHFLLFNQVGQAASRFLSQALGAGRVRLTPLETY